MYIVLVTNQVYVRARNKTQPPLLISLCFSSISCFPKLIQTLMLDKHWHVFDNSCHFCKNAVVSQPMYSGCGRLGALICVRTRHVYIYIYIYIQYAISIWAYTHKGFPPTPPHAGLASRGAGGAWGGVGGPFMGIFPCWIRDIGYLFICVYIHMYTHSSIY